MTPSRFFHLLAALLCLCAASTLRAKTHTLATSGNIAPFIKVEQAFEFAPPIGYIPLRVTISNPYPDTRTWVISNQTRKTRQHNYSAHGHTDWLQDMTVPGGQIRSFDLLYPMVNASTWYNDRNFEVRGPGVNDGFQIKGGTGRSNHNAILYGLASPRIRQKYGDRIASYLDTYEIRLPSGKGEIYYYPKDWRAYAGVNVLWFDQDDWEKLAAESRLPILQWVLQGGDLRILKSEGTQDGAAIGGLPGTGNGLIPHGAGYVRVYPHLSDEALFEYSPQSLEKLQTRPRYARNGTEDEERTPYSEETARVYDALYANFWLNARPLPGLTLKPAASVAALENIYQSPAPNPLLVILAALAVAIILGPVNLWIFARGRKRYRLLLTTPLLSLLLCVVISVIILLDDGTGGKGAYSRLFILSGNNQEVLITNQNSRTGLLLDREFKLPQGVWLTPSWGPEGMQSLDSGPPYGLHNDTYRGNWFGSRRLQQQMTVAVRPSRSGFEVRVKDGEKYIVSSFPATCPVLYLTNADGKGTYRAQDVTTGRPARLEPVSQEEFEQWLVNVHKALGGSAAHKTAQIRVRPHHVYADVEGYTGDAPLALENGIDWQQHASLLVAPATLADVKEDNR